MRVLCMSLDHSFCESFGEMLGAVVQEVSHVLPSGSAVGGRREVRLMCA